MQYTDTKTARIHARRDQIVKAARLCFRRSGFHGAGMAEIAKHAQLSVGQVYRYFENKDAIIEEIVSRIVNNKLQLLTQTGDHTPRMIQKLSTRIMPESDDTREDDQALMLEVTAEATRSPRVAAILQEADSRLFQQASTLLQQRYPQLTPPQIAARVELMAVLSEGTTFRSVAPLKASPEELRQLYQHIFNHVFPETTTND
ncbi:TetR family transcriptional regulator [Brenneria roseae subsp. americana]|uniref:TetR family transcriptional regulator n=1 Tax=Brenneria roseae subsp. americana TaxID=1508507 RepID=A0A2U1TYE4_9GAMM|nr:TetR/AcrR family transcriptional regulator [Brenneria roseae]PWC14426.1 TetR family transcriptional regulator [Brenneria roseae subsp. americana]